jgi:hypothetical protein
VVPGENAVNKAIASTETPGQTAADRANAALARSNAGDKQALQELRQLLDESPDLWLSAGNLALQAELSMIRVAAGENEVLQEAMRRKLAKLRADLAGANPTLLERLLVDRVVAGWLALTYAEANYHQNLTKGLSHEESDHLQRRIDRTHRRYLAAIRSLATVRRLLVPTLQINVAEQQVNVAR